MRAKTVKLIDNCEGWIYYCPYTVPVQLSLSISCWPLSGGAASLRAKGGELSRLPLSDVAVLHVPVPAGMGREGEEGRKGDEREGEEREEGGGEEERRREDGREDGRERERRERRGRRKEEKRGEKREEEGNEG